MVFSSKPLMEAKKNPGWGLQVLEELQKQLCLTAEEAAKATNPGHCFKHTRKHQLEMSQSPDHCTTL